MCQVPRTLRIGKWFATHLYARACAFGRCICAGVDYVVRAGGSRSPRARVPYRCQ